MVDIVWIVVDVVKRDNGGNTIVCHAHKTKASAERFVEDNKKEDPDADFRIQRCFVYDCEDK